MVSIRWPPDGRCSSRMPASTATRLRTGANGKFGPDLTHLMSRTTIAAGAATNTQDNLRLWVKEPDAIKPGALMPAMQLEERTWMRWWHI